MHSKETKNARPPVDLNMSAKDALQQKFLNDGTLQQRLEAFFKRNKKSDFETVWTKMMGAKNQVNSQRTLLNRMSRYLGELMLELCLGNQQKGTADKTLDMSRVLNDEEIAILFSTTIEDFNIDPSKEDKNHKGVKMIDTIIAALPQKFKTLLAAYVLAVSTQHPTLISGSLRNPRIFLANVILTTVKDLRAIQVSKTFEQKNTAISKEITKEEQINRAALKTINDRYADSIKNAAPATKVDAVVAAAAEKFAAKTKAK